MKHLLIAGMLLAALPALAADPLPRAAPETLGLSPERLARVGSTIEAEVREGRMPGAVIAIARRGKLAYYEAFGFQDGGRTRPMTREAIFPIASMTKVLTGADLPANRARASQISGRSRAADVRTRQHGIVSAPISGRRHRSRRRSACRSGDR